MDFGLAQQLVPGDVRLTQTGFAIGTPAYMSPEQANGDVPAMGRVAMCTVSGSSSMNC